MAGASKQNDQLRQIVHSVLVSTRDGLSPARLAGELRDLLGPKAPGERELFEFVRKHPDVVRRRVLPNGRVILHGVVDASVLHIKSMQERQKRSARRFNPPVQREISHYNCKKDPSQNGKPSVSATRENMFSMHTSLPRRQEMPSYPCNFATKVPTLPTKRQGALLAHPPGVLHQEKPSVRRSCHGRGEVRIDFCSDGQREVPVCSTGDSKKPTHPPDTTQRRVSNEPFSAKKEVTIRRTNSRQREVPTQPIGAKQVVTSTQITGASQDKVLTSANYEGMHISHCVSSKQETVPKPANIRDSVPARPVDSRKEERTVEPLSYGYEMMCTVPLDVAMPGSRFQKLSSDFSQLTFMPMYVSAVCSPALFFVQVYGSSTADMLDDLMDDMDILYSDPEVSQQYSIPPSFLVPGFPCAAPYGIGTQSWHRTLLLCLLPNSAGDDASMERQACLYFVDYGDTYNVNVSSLRLLCLSFMELPAQAIPAQLSYLHPPGEQWRLEARDYLLKLTCERVLMALVVGHTEGSKGNKGPVKEQGVKLSICLSDTTGKDDVHINDELVKQGLAMQSRDAEEDLDPAHPYVMYLCKDDSVKTPAFKAEPSCIVDGGCETLTQVSKPKMEAEPGEITEPVLLNLERLLT